jgi:hypothetical protein
LSSCAQLECQAAKRALQIRGNFFVKDVVKEAHLILIDEASRCWKECFLRASDQKKQEETTSAVIFSALLWILEIFALVIAANSREDSIGFRIFDSDSNA